MKQKIAFIKRVDQGRITTVKDLKKKPDVSSVSPSPQRKFRALALGLTLETSTF